MDENDIIIKMSTAGGYMKFLFAPDSFKGTMSAININRLLRHATHRVFGSVEYIDVTMADGGEGTVETVTRNLRGSIMYVSIHGPYMKRREAKFGLVNQKEAILEVAEVVGLALVPEEKRDPRYTSSYGVGELIAHILDDGIRDIKIAIGGTSTNDGGIGAMQALGVHFLDKDGNEVKGIGNSLKDIVTIDTSRMNPLVQEAKFTIMCDVDNPLCGPNGATMCYGKQKGGTPEVLEELEKGMENYRQVLLKTFGKDVNEIPGSGAAGGMGAAFSLFLIGEMKSGIEVVMDLMNFDQMLDGVDYVISGEGRADAQTLHGKVLYGIGKRCKEKNIPVIAICGCLGNGYEALYEHGITKFYATTDKELCEKEILANANDNFMKTAVGMFEDIKNGNIS